MIIINQLKHQLRDPLGEEEDGMDETILPVDHQQAGQIRDTELNRALVAPLPRGVTLHALFDSWCVVCGVCVCVCVVNLFMPCACVGVRWGGASVFFRVC